MLWDANAAAADENGTDAVNFSTKTAFCHVKLTVSGNPFRKSAIY